jgi:dihydrofolate synthase/folylpolyglutamate synthase
MLKFVHLLGNPHQNYPIIHVAGTNGKGSVCAMLDSIYRTNGYKVGLFSSPHLVELGERIRINGENISEQEIESWVEKLRPVAQRMEKEGCEEHPTFFEFMTAIAFLNFQKNKVDLAIIETGLGGRLDSTNVVTPKLSIITTISKDHCAILGNTLEAIAREKAGIIKNKVPVLIGSLPNSATSVIENIAKEKNATLSQIDKVKDKSFPSTNLKGSYQRQNASLALQASKLLKDEIAIKEELCIEALQKVEMIGRWQIIDASPQIILDACHNAAGATCLQENLETLDEKPEIWVGILGEDRAPEIMDVVQSNAQSIKLFEVNQPRACSFSFLRSLIPKSFEGPILDSNLKEAKSDLTHSDKNKTILVTGSIYLIGDILSILQETDFEQKTNWNDLF